MLSTSEGSVVIEPRGCLRGPVTTRANAKRGGRNGPLDKLKTGFYFTAVEANVHILMVTFDYGNKEIRMAEPFLPTNKEADFEKIDTFFRGVEGYYPAKSFV